MKKRLLLLSFLAGLCLFAFVVWKTGAIELLKAIATLSPLEFILILLTYVFQFGLMVLSLKVVLDSMGIKVPLRKWTQIHLVKYAVSYLTPFMNLGGEPVAIFMLFKHAKVKLTKATSAIILERVLRLTITVLLIVIGVVMVLLRYTISKNTLALLIVTICLFVGLLYYFYLQTFKGIGILHSFTQLLGLYKFNWFKNIKQEIHSVDSDMTHFMKKTPKSFYFVLFLSFLISLLIMMRYRFILLFLGYDLSFVSILFIFALANILAFVPLPASLGALEGAQALTFALFGLGSTAGVAFTLALRIVDVIAAGPGLLLILYFGMGLVKMFKKESWG